MPENQQAVACGKSMQRVLSNLASRIETACAQTQVYISSNVAQYLEPGACVEVGDFKLKGIEEAMKLYMLSNDNDDSLEP